MLSLILKQCSFFLPFPAVGVVLSTFLTYLAIFFLPRLGYIDIPRGRHQHAKPIPRGGGMAIGAAFFVTILLFSATLQDSNVVLYRDVMDFLRHFWLPAGIILLTGVLDDRYELRSVVKLLAQILAGVILYFQGSGIIHFFSYQLPMPLALAVTVFWSVIIINAFNLIDGLDGIAAGLAVISSFLLAVWTLLSNGSDAMVIILLIFCSSCLGFLRYNFSPAKIFMGDTGSMFLGLFFAYVSMSYSAKSVTLTALLVPLAAIGVPMFDVFLAIWRRFFRRYINKDPNSSIMQGDHDHLHHRILKETGKTRKTAFIIYALSLSFSLLAMVGVFLESHFPAMIFVLLLVTFFVMIRYSSIELFDTLTSVAKGVQMSRRNALFTAIHPFIDGILVFLAFLVCRGFYAEILSKRLPEAIWFLIHVAPFVLVLCFSGIYRTFWLRAGLIQYYKLLRLLGIAGAVGYFLNCAALAYYWELPHNELGEFSRFYVAFLLFAYGFILLERFLIRYYESWGYRRLFIRNQGTSSTLKRVLIYGGGLLCRMYITKQFSGWSIQKENVKIIGLVDDDLALRHLNVYGFKVLGSLYDLDEIYRRTPFETILIACEFSEPEKIQLLKDFQKSSGVEILHFVCNEEKLEL